MNVAHQRGLFAIIAAALLWSSGGIFIKLIQLNPFQISFLRAIFSSLIILAVSGKKVFTFSRSIAVTGVCYAAILILFVMATKTTSAANAIFLQYTAPVYVLVLEPYFLKTKLEKINIYTMLFCLLGMALFFAESLAPGDFIGNIYALCSGIAFAGFLLMLRKADDDHRYASIFWGNVFILVLCSFSMGSAGTVRIPDLLMCAYLGVFQIGIAYVLFSYGIKYTHAIEAGLISMIEPVLNPVWVVIWYGEVPTRSAILGGIIILITLAVRTVITERKKTRIVQG